MPPADVPPARPCWIHEIKHDGFAQFKQLLVAALNEEKAARAAGGGTQPRSAKERPPKHKK
jgi:hypothetical protein